ncbi:tyrosine-type recombinase/integrase [Fulvivirga sedimenti]|uniref:Tyrosine-type recombinase/integrase n=1 Tax=Fulvivirga sedimenti TaxID=2879465 RepID=A0A9X1HPY7_9BACT|nr:tyrosine-type recombinase/integrase [Fulvivirga sedimenti]MCA6076168.1 tyrosine-type recombinase/integrase [Fulvivirga sedimenti]MCA6077296.1 tyrosine-type recombinase/integrase [Fulvivirga sedimenti]
MEFCEGPCSQRHSASSIRKILKRSCTTAGISKRVTPHTLRNSYATHMLELGVDIRYIQAMLGHRRPETTMIYTHISTHKIQNLPNPLDELVREQLESLPNKEHSNPSNFPLIPGKLWGY